MSKTKIRVHFTYEEAIKFLPSVVGMLNFYGFHVVNGDEALSCVEGLCKRANKQEIDDAMVGSYCKFCKGDKPA